MLKLRSSHPCSQSFNSWESTYQFDFQPLFWPSNGAIIINEPLVTRLELLPKTIMYMQLSFIGLLNIKIIYIYILFIYKFFEYILILRPNMTHIIIKIKNFALNALWVYVN